MKLHFGRLKDRVLMKLQSRRLKAQGADEAIVRKDRLGDEIQSGRLKGQGADEATVWKAERTQGRTDIPKAICFFNFFKVWGIIIWKKRILQT